MSASPTDSAKIKINYRFWQIMRPADYVLIICLLLFAVLLTIGLGQSSSKQWVDIYVDNEIVESVPLEKDAKIVLEGKGIVEISSGQVRISESTCEHHLCEKQGWSGNLPIICVPNKVALVIRKNDPEMIITK
ncbi:MAG: NusG domain II-containing protein [Candidatus Cloacimonadales bacterium]